MSHHRPALAEGRLIVHRRFSSKFLSTRRDLIAYLPPGYHEARSHRYPVLYLQDGQNLFDAATAFCGQEWHVDITADEMHLRGEIRTPIIVGIYNTGARRISEYTPTRDPRTRKGGKADRYAEMLAREIKPFIDHEYRTLKPARFTAVGGSSLGALVSLVAGLQYPKVFGGVAVLSPSVWWDNCSILTLVKDFRLKPKPRIWLDVGTEEGSHPAQVVADTRTLRQELLAKHWVDADDLSYHEFEGAAHAEWAWAARFGAVLRYLFPPG